MLDHAQLTHFTRRGWILLEDQITPQGCQAYIAALDRLAVTRKPVTDYGAFDDMTIVDNLPMCGEQFLDWFRIPGLLDSFRQLAGYQLRFTGANAHIKGPPPDRHGREAQLKDPADWPWHRAVRAKYTMVAHDADASLLNCTYLNSITYLTPVSPWDGSTAVLDG